MRKPSEVFLKLWRWRTTNDTTATDEDFTLCAEAWEEIRKMEAEKEWTEIRDSVEDVPDKPVGDMPAAKPSGWQIWKEKVRDRLLSTRFSTAQVAEDAEVKVDDVRALTDSTNVPASLIRAIEKGLEKLEG